MCIYIESRYREMLKLPEFGAVGSMLCAAEEAWAQESTASAHRVRAPPLPPANESTRLLFDGRSLRRTGGVHKHGFEGKRRERSEGEKRETA